MDFKPKKRGSPNRKKVYSKKHGEIERDDNLEDIYDNNYILNNENLEVDDYNPSQEEIFKQDKFIPILAKRPKKYQIKGNTHFEAPVAGSNMEVHIVSEAQKLPELDQVKVQEEIKETKYKKFD